MMSGKETNDCADADPGHALAAARNFYEALLDAEWTSPVKLAGFQEDTLKRYLSHTIAHVPYHRERLGVLLDQRGNIDLRRWLDVPIMTSRDLEAHHGDITAHDIPPEHGRTVRQQIYGPDGPAVTLSKSGLNDTAMTCAFYRQVHAFGLDWNSDLISIRAYDPIWGGRSAGETAPDIWGPAWMKPACTGQRTHLSVHTPVRQQLDLLGAKSTVYVSTSPFNAYQLAAEVARSGDPAPNIAAVLTAGEYVSDDLRAQCKRYLNCDVVDVFSTAQCGMLATQCPESGGYHMLPEVSVLEVLKPDGSPCGPGQTGLVTATPLYNYAMPLVRYQSDDLVTVGGACACGRAAPVLSRLYGRLAHHFITPDGSRVRPEMNSEELRRHIGFRRWRLVQIGQDHAQLQVMDRRGEGPADHAGVSTYLAGLLHSGTTISVKTVAALGPTSQGTYAAVECKWASTPE